MLTTLLLAGPLFAADPAPVPVSVVVHPNRLVLKQLREPHSLIVSGRTADGFSVDLGKAAQFSSNQPQIAAVDANGWVRPVANGTAEITVVAGGQTLKVPVDVSLPEKEPLFSFRHEVMPVFSKAGCNLGACHGYSLGKGGLKLSLRGQEHEPDFLQITRDQIARRVNPFQPELSLLVTKPVGMAPHYGGVRFAKNSLPYEILTKWIGQGAPGDLKDTNEVVRVQVFPERLVLRPGQTHQAQLIAEYSNGAKRDVTRLGCFSANNELYATVDDAGQIASSYLGETAVVARFERKFAAVDVIVLKPVPSFQMAPVPQDHLVDKFVFQKLNDLKVNMSQPATDEEFLRRVHLDLIGLQPTPDEVRAFVADTAADKRTKTIDRLLERPEYVDHWSLKWGDLLQNSRNSLSPSAVYLFREWIRSSVAANMPLDEFARRLLTARGGVQDDPASPYLTISKDVNDTVERTTQVFCGVRMLCARCHAHPMENWTQVDYFGVASFFNQLATKPDPRTPNVPNSKVLFVNAATGPAGNPRTGRPQPPRFLGGEEPQLAPNIDRRDTYARWLTGSENPFFARGLTNRIWSYFFHRGIVEPVDDVRNTNPPINPELLDALTKDFIAHRFDVKHLMRTIVTSRTYQASSLTNATNDHDTQNFSRAIPRRIPAEALLDSLVQATGVREGFSGVPGTFSASQLPDANVNNDFLNLFGKPQRMEACECERDGGSNMLQALHLINGPAILNKVTAGNSRVAQLIQKKVDDPQLVSELYLWSICRAPTEKELAFNVAALKEAGDKRIEVAQDIMWALLNSRDFMLVR